MKKEDLEKLGLSEEFIKKILALHDESLKGFIPKSRFDEVNNDKKKLETDIQERDTQLEKLKGATGDIESLKKTIETLQSENKTKSDEYSAKIKQIKLDNAIETAVLNAKAKNNIAVRALLKLEGLEVSEDGTVKGLKEQLDNLSKSENTKFLFNQEKIKGASAGQSDPEAGGDKIDLSKLSYDELCKHFKNEE